MLNKNISNDTLAKQLDITPTHLSAIRTWRSIPSLGLLTKIQEVLEMNITIF